MRIWVLAILAFAGCSAGFQAGGFAPAPPMYAGHATASVSVSVSFFGVPLDGAQDVVFVLDRSGSMNLVSTGFSGKSVGLGAVGSAIASLGATAVDSATGSHLPTKLEAAKQELVRTLRMMPDGTRFNVIFFDDEIAALSQHMMTLHPGSRAGVEAFILGIKPGGSTAAVPALELAYAINARRIILLSDGLANSGGDGRDLLDRARSQIAMGVRFDTVGIGLDQDQDLMQSLAAESGGLALMR